MATLNGIDISSWQTGIDLSAVPADFVLVKATEATNYVNPDCDRAFQQAARAGKLLGVYHFARPGDARAQADFFIAQCRGYIGRAVLVLDWEANALPLGPSWAKAWLDRVHQVTGIRPLIYMSASVTGEYDWTAVVKANYGLWVAAYALGDQRIDGYRVPSGHTGVKYWPTVAIWQYTSSGRLSGWGGKLDLNIFYGDRAAWAKYAGGAPASGAYVPPVKPTAKVDIRALQKAVRATPDNIAGPDTRTRVSLVAQASAWGKRKFPNGIKATQRVVGTSPDGSWGPKSIAAHDATVIAIQKALNALGHRLNEDGIWGPKTEAASKAALDGAQQP